MLIAQCGFRPGRSTMDQIFALQQIFEKSWEYAKEVNACFVDLEKAYDRNPRDKLWAVLLQYCIDGQLLTAIKSLYMRSEVCVRVNSATTKPFRVSVGLRQGCSLSFILFLYSATRLTFRFRRTPLNNFFVAPLPHSGHACKTSFGYYSLLNFKY